MPSYANMSRSCQCDCKRPVNLFNLQLHSTVPYHETIAMSSRRNLPSTANILSHSKLSSDSKCTRLKSRAFAAFFWPARAVVLSTTPIQFQLPLLRSCCCQKSLHPRWNLYLPPRSACYHQGNRSNRSYDTCSCRAHLRPTPQTSGNESRANDDIPLPYVRS